MRLIGREGFLIWRINAPKLVAAFDPALEIVFEFLLCGTVFRNFSGNMARQYDYDLLVESGWRVGIAEMQLADGFDPMPFLLQGVPHPGTRPS